jgi:TonB family protein
MNSTTAKGLAAHRFWVYLFVCAWVIHPSLARQQAAHRIHLTQDQLCCFDMRVVDPIYPREARLAHTEGIVKVVVVFADEGSVADLRAVSGDPVLVDSTMKAVRQWHFSMGGSVAGGPRETEVPLSFTFKIETPKPAYLHLSNGRVIRADNVREFADRIEYTVGRRTHHISLSSVTDVSACARIAIELPMKEGSCIPGGGPSFLIRALPLLPGPA